MPEENHIKIGSVWKKRTNRESMVDKICVVGVNRKMKLVFCSGFVDEVDPVISFEYLLDTFYPDDYWNTVA